MDADDLVKMVLRSVMGGRKKRGRRARRYLTGRSFWSKPSTVMTAAGVAWGLFETMQRTGGQATAQPTSPSYPAAGPAPGAAPAAAAPPAAPPPAPDPVPVPPAPVAAPTPAPEPPAASAPETPPMSPEDEDALRIVRLAVSAAFADGVVNEHEKAAILHQAREAGVGDVVEAEIRARRPLREIVAGVSDQTRKVTLYVLAFTILRADEQLSGAERIYLAQLAHLLGLDPQEVEALEKDVGERIDALGDQGQLGG